MTPVSELQLCRVAFPVATLVDLEKHATNGVVSLEEQSQVHYSAFVTNHEALDCVYDSDSISSLLDEDDFAIIELIRNIPNKMVLFENKNLVASVSKLVGVIKPSKDRLALLHNLKEFSHTLTTKFMVPSASNISLTIDPPPQSLDTVLDKEPSMTDISILDPFVDFSNFTW